ncbi:hypothetical protein KIW84_020352 [Lathyrus oleraceus]|uniref:Uncharacterized protein n=1 Tax=Pisum sativum TaxID=3888 RepID=A0A9D4Y5F4_PEA|nr:hypothetical protein KIW84_020352 [Pisum sativum]
MPHEIFSPSRSLGLLLSVSYSIVSSFSTIPHIQQASGVVILFGRRQRHSRRYLLVALMPFPGFVGLACEALAGVISLASSEIDQNKRNKMAPHRAETLACVRSNLRLLSRSTPQYYQEETKMWNVAGDESESLDDSGFLEVDDLFLDGSDLRGRGFQCGVTII